VAVAQLAKSQGDFLLVGLHNDEDVAERRGPHLPIMDLHERSLSVLACRYVNECIIGDPLASSKQQWWLPHRIMLVGLVDVDSRDCRPS
jgi:glycerol-3-phosphate cytidylyltransferase-like family protein